MLFNSPFMIIGFIIAILLFIFDMVKRPKSIIAIFVAVLIAVAMISYSLIMGATMQEVLIIILIFSALALNVFIKKEGK